MLKILTCKCCGKQFQHRHKKKKYCIDCIDNPPFCKCGCGKRVTGPNQKYIFEHHLNGKCLTDQHKLKIGLALKGIKRTDSFKNNLSIKLKGKTFTEEHKKKLSISAKKRCEKPEHREKLVKRWIALSEKRNLESKGKTLIEIYGAVKAEIIRNKMIAKAKARRYKPESRQKNLDHLKKVNSDPDHGRKLSIGRIRYLSSGINVVHKRHKSNTHDTNIEIAFEKCLQSLNITYKKQVPLIGRTIVDFLLPDKVVVYCDGNYWHNFPGVPEHDKLITLLLTQNGYKVYRFWVKELMANPLNCLMNILKNEKENCNE